MTTTKPYQKMRELLVHTKDKQKAVDQQKMVYAVPCSKGFERYIGERGREIDSHIKEHKAEVEQAQNCHRFPRLSRSKLTQDIHKFVIIDCVMAGNHIIEPY